MDHEVENKVILWFTAIVLIMGEAIALGMKSHYKFDFIFLMALLLGVFAARKHLDLHPGHYAIFSFFLIIHDLGMFKAYQWTILGLEYDYWVHFIFGMISALIIVRAYDYTGLEHGLMKYVMVLIIVLGFSAAHELYEFGGAVLLGEGEGVLFIGAGDLDQWDTQKDMLNNLIGGIVAVLMYLPFSIEKVKR